MNRAYQAPATILMAASEAAPLAKTGGLGDVAGALPEVLGGLGLRVILALPYTPQAARCGLALSDTGLQITVPGPGDPIQAGVWETALGSARAFLIRHDPFFGREGLYGDAHGDYADNAARFIFFCRAVIELARALELESPLVHAHDWQTALLPAYIRTKPFDLGPLAGAASVLTIHNLAYQGIFARKDFALTGLPEYFNSVAGMEYWGKISFLKAGLITATALTTVSPGYAREIQTPLFGCGMEGVIARRKDALQGILNGVDYAAWSPEKDTLLPAQYSPQDLSGKAVCQKELMAAFGLKDPGRGVLGFVGRLVGQKGVDLLARAAPGLVQRGARLCVLGTGQSCWEEELGSLAREHLGCVGARLEFNEKLAHLVFAGSDLLLMPSKFEPCGLNQLYALRYGTPPVATATGGLKDTVGDFDQARGLRNGFLMASPQADELTKAALRGLALKPDRESWHQVVHNAMAQDFSWQKSAQKYLGLYRSLLRKQ